MGTVSLEVSLTRPMILIPWHFLLVEALDYQLYQKANTIKSLNRTFNQLYHGSIVHKFG